MKNNRKSHKLMLTGTVSAIASPRINRRAQTGSSVARRRFAVASDPGLRPLPLDRLTFV
jgi:hypothetical protein